MSVELSTTVFKTVCDRLGRRPVSIDELTDDERRQLDIEDPARTARSRPVERRANV